jgi:dTDP-4-amino-4,6-dideoxygalactose transaminase
MSNICAGIGRGQMYVLEEHINARRRNHALYREKLKDIDGISFLVNPNPDYQSNHWLTCIIVDPSATGFTREELRLKMEEANIETRPLWKPMHLQPVFADCPFYGNNTSERLFEKGLCLPSGPALTSEDINRVVNVILNLIS